MIQHEVSLTYQNFLATPLITTIACNCILTKAQLLNVVLPSKWFSILLLLLGGILYSAVCLYCVVCALVRKNDFLLTSITDCHELNKKSNQPYYTVFPICACEVQVSA